MPPKRAPSAKKKLTKKEIEAAQAEMELAQATAAAAKQAREDAVRLLEEQKRREEEEMIVRENIDVPKHAEADARAILMKSFGHLYPTPLPIIQPTLPTPVEPTPAAAPSTPTQTIRPGSSKKRVGSSSGKKTTPGSSPRPNTSSGKNKQTTADGSDDSPATSQKKSSGKDSARKSPAPVKRKLTMAEQTALAAEEAAAEHRRLEEQARAQAEYERLHPKFSPETEAKLESLKQGIIEKKEYTEQAEKVVLDYYAKQVESNVAENERLVNGFNLLAGVDIPDEQRRLKETPLIIPSEPASKTLPPRTDKQVLSSSALIDLQAILDRQQARQAALNQAIRYVDPESNIHGAKKKRASRKAALETGVDKKRSHASAEELIGVDGQPLSPRAKVHQHASAERVKLVKAIMPFSEIKANQAILEHMQTLQNFPRNPRYDDRNNRQGGPGGKGLMKVVRDKRATSGMDEEEKTADSFNHTLSYSSLPKGLESFLTSLTPEEALSRKNSCLESFPPIAWFTQSWQKHEEMTTEIEIKNIGTLSRRIRVEPPRPSLGQQNGYFSVEQPRYMGVKDPANSTALLAPGMSCFIKVHFRPDALCDFSSVFKVVTETGEISIPLYAKRPFGSIDLPEHIEVGVCAWNDSLVRSLSVRNTGKTTATFWAMQREKFQEYERRKGVKERALTSPRHRPILGQSKSFSSAPTPLFTSKALVSFLQSMSPEDTEEDFTELSLGEGGTFKISPASWTLAPGESTELMIEYQPVATKEQQHTIYFVQELEERFIVLQDNTRVSTHAISGKTCEIRLELEAVDGLDLEALKSSVALAAIQRRSDAAALREKMRSKSRQGTGLDVAPLPPPPHPPSLDQIGPGSPREERLKELSLTKTINLKHALPNYEDHVLSVADVAGMITPRSSRVGTARSAGVGVGEEQPVSVEFTTADHAALIRSFNSLVFPDTELSAQTVKTVTLRNSTPLPVAFNWKLSDLGALFPHSSTEVAKGAFKVAPAFGRFEPHSTQTFTFTFSPTFPIHFQQKATFVVENVPESHHGLEVAVDSHRAASDSEDEEQAEEKDSAAGDEDDSNADDAFTTTLTQARRECSGLVDLAYFALTLSGFGTGVKVDLAPQPLVVFEHPIPLDGRPVRKLITLMNVSTLKSAPAASFHFSAPIIKFVRSQGISDHLAVDEEVNGTDDPSSALGPVRISPSLGEIPSGQSLQVEVEFAPRLLGAFNLTLECYVDNLADDGPLTTQMSFKTVGPRIQIVSPAPGLLDFGLLNFGIPGVAASQQLVFRNMSRTVPAYWSLGEQGREPLPFFRVGGVADSLTNEPPSDIAQARVDSEEIEEGLLTFTPARGILAAGETESVTVTFTPRSTEALRSSVVLHTKHSSLPFVQLIECRAQVQAPVLTCTPCVIELDRTVLTQIDDAEEERKRLEKERLAREAREAEQQRVEAEALQTARAKADRIAAESKAAIDAQIRAAAEAKEAAEREAALAKARKKMTPAQRKKEQMKIEAEALAKAQAEAEAAVSLAASLMPTPRDIEEVTEVLQDVVAQLEAEVPPPLAAYLPPEEEKEKINHAILKQPSVLCVRVPRVFEVTLRNLTNLPAVYRWNIVGEGSESVQAVNGESTAAPTLQDLSGSSMPTTPARNLKPYEVRFSPPQGTLEGREEKIAYVTLTAFRSGPLHLLLACDIEGVSKPLGVEIKATVKDLTVSYHGLQPEEAKAMEAELAAQPMMINNTPRKLGASASATGSVVSALRGFQSSRSMRSQATDFSTAEGIQKLEQRKEVLDRWIPAKQVHSKITSEAEAAVEQDVFEDQPLEDPTAEEESQQAVAGQDAIIPTASAMPVLDFGSRLAPGTRKTLCLILRNHTVIPARFSARVAKQPPCAPPAAQDKLITSPIARALLERKKSSTGSLGNTVQLEGGRKVLSTSASIVMADASGSPYASTASFGKAPSDAPSHRNASSVMSAAGSGRGQKGKQVVVTLPPSEKKLPSLSAEYESAQRFQSKAGQAVTAELEIQAATRAVIPQGQGVAFQVSAATGLLEPYATYRLDVTVLTDACGLFDDELIIHVKGLGSVRVPLKVGVSGLALSFSPKNLGLLFPESPLAARNRIEQAQRTAHRPILEKVSEEDGDEARFRGEELLLAKQADFVQHGFDQHPKLFFRPILVHVDEKTKKLSLLGGGSGTNDVSEPNSFDRRLTYNNTADGNVSDRKHVVSGDQVRTVIVDNNGPTDVKIIWQQYDLRSIQHNKVVDIKLNLSPQGEEKEDGESLRSDNSVVKLDVSRYTYPKDGDETSRTLNVATQSSIGADTSRSISSSPEPIPPFPFILDPPELIVPSRSSSSFRIIYDPTRWGHSALIDHTAGPSHDINFIEGLLFIPAVTPPTEPSPRTADLTPQISARSKKLEEVLGDIDSFESRVDTKLESLSDDESDDETSDLAKGRPLVGHTSSLLRANRLAKFFAPKAAVNWLPAPEQISEHRFRLVLSGRSIVPELKVDKSKGRIKFVCQIPRPESAPATTSAHIAPTSPSGSTSLAATLSRPLATIGNSPKAASVVAQPTIPNARAQLTMTKMLPLSNPTSVTLHFRASVYPVERFSLVTPPSSSPSAARRTIGPPVVQKKSSTLPLQSHLGWKHPTGAPYLLTLLPGESLVLPIKFTAPRPDSQDWPYEPRVEVNGAVELAFENGSTQLIPLQADLLRPILLVQPTLHDFGTLHTVESSDGTFGVESEEIGGVGSGSEFTRARALQRLSLIFSNAGLVDAHWTMVHIPAPKAVSQAKLRHGQLKESMHPQTLKNMTSTEFNDDADCVDDPSAFVFQQTAGIVPAGAGTLNQHANILPTGVVTETGLSSLPHTATYGRNVSGLLSDGRPLVGSTKPEVIQRIPVQLSVAFRPKLKKRYKSIFRIRCMHGAEMGETMDIELRGTGAYEESIPTV